MKKDKELYRVIGANLRMIRKKSGQTQIEVAKALGVPSSVISMMESGRRKTTVSHLVWLADYYGIPVSNILPPPVVMQPEIKNVTLVDVANCFYCVIKHSFDDESSNLSKALFDLGAMSLGMTKAVGVMKHSKAIRTGDLLSVLLPLIAMSLELVDRLNSREGG